MKFSEIGIGKKFSPVGSNAEYKKVSANEGQLLHCRVVIDFPSSAKVCPTKHALDGWYCAPFQAFPCRKNYPVALAFSLQPPVM